ncbi:MAG: HNH endonuclease [Propionibacteriaceae bacterium]|jgi:hypothetical protein|nr:HNH endonuclease [Propionibacteriaceae bacterium]
MQTLLIRVVAAAVVTALAVLSFFVIRFVIRRILKARYFASQEFRAHKAALAAVVAEHNEIAYYAEELRRWGSYQLGRSSSGDRAHLSSFENTSRWNYRRDRNRPNYQAPNVHNCSLQIVRRASAEPLKYLMKYFDIRADEPTLGAVEQLGENIARLENAMGNLHSREVSIARSFRPPRFILKHYRDEFMDRAGVYVSPIAVPYPVYVFEYVSAGGNSSQRARVWLDTPTIDALANELCRQMRFQESAAGQRALMTAGLREAIKKRDGYTCRYCGVSLAAEPHLLLEVDHIIPVSRGGRTTPHNLQTLCWRCNRTKSNKLTRH